MNNRLDFPRTVALAVLATALTIAASPSVAHETEPTAPPPPPKPVHAFGNAGALDVSFGGGPVAIASHPRRAGFWLVNDGGEVGAYGSASHVGDIPGLRYYGVPVGDPEIVAIAPTPSGEGYWLLDSIGGVFSFGDAKFHGSVPGLRSQGHDIGQARIVDMAATPSGRGYWLVDEHGGVFALGDARFRGSLPGLRAAGAPIGPAPVVDIAATPRGSGYWMLDSSGGVFTFGRAPYRGSLPALQAEGRLSASPGGSELVPTNRGGYWILDMSGGVFAFGASFRGSAAGQPGNAVGLAPTPDDGGYWIAMRQSVDAPPLPPDSGTGRRVVYCNSCQRMWLVEGNGFVVRSYQVSGRSGVPSPGTYSVFSKSRYSTDQSGRLRLDYMTRFAHGQTLAIGFHGIPIDRSTGEPIQSNEELGEFRSAGCVRQAHEDAAFLWDWAPVGTTVVVTA